MSSEVAIEASNVYKVFGRRPAEAVRRLERGESRDDVQRDGTAAVIDASFTVNRGEIFVVMGLSGSGKSTLIRMLNGLWEPTSGSIKIDGTNITGISPAKLRNVRKSSVSMVFQHFALLPHRTVLDNVAYGLEIQGVGREERQDKALEIIGMVGLAGWEDHLPGQLSGGMQQRVGLARALTADTGILLMDEAFSALDPLIRREMQEELLHLQEKLGKTIVFITHDLNEAMFLGDRIAVMRDGRVVQIDTPANILTDPANDYVAQFVQDIDRSRVLTAGNAMDKARAIVKSTVGIRGAVRTMRDLQTSAVMVTGRNGALLGSVHDRDALRALKAGVTELDTVLRQDVTTVEIDAPLADVLLPSVESLLPLAVVDADGRVKGVLPRVTLLAALANHESTTGELPVVEPASTVSTETFTESLNLISAEGSN
ncbi:quaternary amine ABC transporter ATP-binding protein [Humidisolicoccus flavus]|uniref:quaternary amine ABC transporter ATP-binding protein n=1 Tax=Humidisolicoccus flavus TaxID=3111414 RepID=UPI0032441568